MSFRTNFLLILTILLGFSSMISPFDPAGCFSHVNTMLKDKKQVISLGLCVASVGILYYLLQRSLVNSSKKSTLHHNNERIMLVSAVDFTGDNASSLEVLH